MRSSNIVVAIILVSIGAIWTLSNYGVLPFKIDLSQIWTFIKNHFIKLFPLLFFIYLAISILTDGTNKENNKKHSSGKDGHETNIQKP